MDNLNTLAAVCAITAFAMPTVAAIAAVWLDLKGGDQ